MANPYDFQASSLTVPVQKAYGPYVFGSRQLQSPVLVHPTAPGALDHCALGLDRLIDRARKPKIEAYLCALITPLQGIEQALLDVEAFTSLDTAVGVQLDKNGADLGEGREGLSNTEYRSIQKGKALARASKGRADELIDILVQLDDGFDPASVQLIEHFPAGFIMTVIVPVNRRELGERYARVLRHAKARGVAFMLMFEEQRSDLFVWSGTAGEGWQDDANPTITGGIWAEAI